MSAEARRRVVRALRDSTVVRRSSRGVWGLDWIDVEPLGEGAGWVLRIWFVSSVVSSGGVPPGLDLQDFTLETSHGEAAVGWELSELEPAVSSPAVLHLKRSAGAGAWTDPSVVLVYRGPLGSDGAFSVDPLRDRHEIVFSPVNLDTATPEPAPEVAESPIVGDFSLTRSALLHRLSLTAPQWQERSEADPWMALVELLAWAGKELFAYQDAVATEAWLSTARKRVSLRRHARLLGFTAHDGCSCRAWVHVVPQAEAALPAGSSFSTQPYRETASNPSLRTFRSLHSHRLAPDLENLSFYRWGAEQWILPKGTTHFALEGHVRGLDEGAFLLMPGPSVVRVKKLRRAVDPLTRCAITEVEVPAEDALTQPIAAESGGASANVVACAEGTPFVFGELPEVTAGGAYRFPLRGRRLTRFEPFHLDRVGRDAASTILRQRPQAAVVDLEVSERRPGGRLRGWQVKRDLLSSGPYDRHVVAELGDGSLVLRFGDGVNGRPAPCRSLLRVAGREVGVAREPAQPGTLLFSPDSESAVHRASLVFEAGAVEPISASQIRLKAPSLATVPTACQSEEDYARIAGDVKGVLQAHCEVRWTGSWYTAFVWVLPQASDTLSSALEQEIRQRLDPLRQLGVDLDIRAPDYVPARIGVRLTLDPQAVAGQVLRALRRRLGSAKFFARSEWQMGRSVSRGALEATVCAVEGVEDAEVICFHREDEPVSAGNDWVVVSPREVIRVGLGGAEPVSLEVVSR